MKKTFLFAIVSVTIAFVYSCQHQPPVVPSDNTGNNNPGGGGGTTNTCNPDSVYFENDILPLLISNCGMPGCHDAAYHAEGINITTYTTLMNANIVVAGKPSNSKLIKSINETKPDDIMPRPPRDPLTAEQKAKLTKWIEQGARNNKCDNGCDTTQFKFATNVKPIIDANCVGCHNASLASGGVMLTNYGELKTQADNGNLFGTINHKAGNNPMPLGTKLPDCQIIIINKWIQAGALNN